VTERASHAILPHEPDDAAGGRNRIVSTNPKSVAILGYHKIGEPPGGTWSTWNYVPKKTFVRHLELLRHRDWPVIDLDAFLEGLQEPDALPPRSALLTFDDAYRSLRDVAEPLLRRFACPAVVFVPTDFVGGTNRFDHGNEPEERICDWEDLSALEDRGISIQSHSLSHRPFSELDPEALEEEIARSKRLLDEHLARPVEALAFPFGDEGRDPDRTGALLRNAGYRAAFLFRGGPARLPARDVYRLPRFPVGPDTDLEAKLRAWEDSEDGAR